MIWHRDCDSSPRLEITRFLSVASVRAGKGTQVQQFHYIGYCRVVFVRVWSLLNFQAMDYVMQVSRRI